MRFDQLQVTRLRDSSCKIVDISHASFKIAVYVPYGTPEPAAIFVNHMFYFPPPAWTGSDEDRIKLPDHGHRVIYTLDEQGRLRPRREGAMSYPRDLDEIPDNELYAELKRREQLRAQGLCDYCGRSDRSEPACKFPDRHHPDNR